MKTVYMQCDITFMTYANTEFHKLGSNSSFAACFIPKAKYRFGVAVIFYYISQKRTALTKDAYFMKIHYHSEFSGH